MRQCCLDGLLCVFWLLLLAVLSLSAAAGKNHAIWSIYQALCRLFNSKLMKVLAQTLIKKISNPNPKIVKPQP